MPFVKAPPTGIQAMKEKAGNRFVGTLEAYEEVLEGSFKDEKGDPKPDHFYTFRIEESNFPGMRTGEAYRFAAPTRFHREICKFPDVLTTQRFEVTYTGEEKTKHGGKAANFTILRDE